MSQKRFKTEKELIESGWKKESTCFHKRQNTIITNMIPALGEPYNNTSANCKLPRDCGIWSVSEEMLTDKPLIPIGSKVAIPLTKLGLKNSETRFIYYGGINSNQHILSLTEEQAKDNSGNYYYASEILEAYERYNKENNSEETIAKKGEWVKIVNFGRASASNSYSLYIPYQLRQDLNKIYGFQTVVDNNGSKTNGWNNSFDLNMKFEKCTEKEVLEIESKLLNQSNKLSQEQILEEAKRRYSLNCKFKPAHIDNTKNYCIITEDTVIVYDKINDRIIATVNGFHWRNDKKYGDTTYNRILYEKGKWAEIIEDKQTYKENDWIYYERSGNIAIIKLKEVNNQNIVVTKLAIHYLEINTYYYDECSFCDIKDIKRLATKQEVEKALLEIAKEKGFIDEVEFKSAYPSVGNFKGKINLSVHCNINNIYDANLYASNAYIYYNNIWAEIIKEKKVLEKSFNIEHAPKIALKGDYKSVREFNNILVKVGYNYNDSRSQYSIDNNTRPWLLNYFGGIKENLDWNETNDNRKSFILPEQFNKALEYLGLSEYKKEIIIQKEKMNSLPDKSVFYGQKIDCVNLHNFKKVQEFLFKLGYSWFGGSIDIQTKAAFTLHMYSDNTITWSSEKSPNLVISYFSQWIKDLDLPKHNSLDYINRINSPNIIKINSKISINQKQTTENGRSIKVQSKINTVSISERRTGSTISGRRSRATITRGYYSNKEINCK